jgi:ribosome-associated protein
VAGRRDGDAEHREKTVAVVRLPVALGPFLKLAGFARSGGEAKGLCAVGAVHVNGAVEHRRGRRLVAGDRVDVLGHARAAVVVAADRTEPSG